MKTFFLQSLRRWNEMGSAFPCSNRAVQQGLSLVHLDHADTIVEFGCGTGVFTKHIQSKLGDGQLFFALEINEHLINEAQTRSPGSLIYHDSAENVMTYLAKHGKQSCDIIISTLPWAIFTEQMQRSLLDAAYNALDEHGEFVTIAYNMGTVTPSANRFRSLLDSYFSTVKKSPTVWRNMPPAFFYYCKK